MGAYIGPAIYITFFFFGKFSQKDSNFLIYKVTNLWWKKIVATVINEITNFYIIITCKNYIKL